MSDEIKISTSQLYRNLFSRLWKLVSQPASEWNSIKNEDKSFNAILADFALPLMGLNTLATFIGFIFNHQGFNLELSMKHATVVFVSLFGGLYLVFFIMGVILSVTGLKRREVMTLTAYSSGLWYVVAFVTALIPQMVGIYIFAIYSLYIAYKGVQLYLPFVQRSNQIIMSVLFFLLIHLIPFLIKFTLLKFITF